MGFISDFTIEKYTQVLNDAANKLINHQQATQAEVALSNSLITDMVNLRKAIGEAHFSKRLVCGILSYLRELFR
jgi:hypothetical protein